jgi:hypothetical protein
MNVKQRFDNGGSEFGKVHRELPISCGMFDIDRMSATATIDLELKNQDVGFIEYSTNFTKNEIVFKAMFEVKHKYSESVNNVLRLKVGSASWAQYKMCQKLNCRYFIVVANYGVQPFDFYESIDNKMEFIGKLEYNNENKKQMINEFWIKINLL